ncbi:MAG: hypothetical protein ACLTZU_00510 [Odoribacter splanchnicus]
MTTQNQVGDDIPVEVFLLKLLDLLKVDFGQVHGIGFYDKIVTSIRRFSGDRLSFQRQTGEEDWQD